MTAGTALVAWGLYKALFQVQGYIVSAGGSFQVAMASYASAPSLLLVLGGVGAMMGGVAMAELAGRRQT